MYVSVPVRACVCMCVSAHVMCARVLCVYTCMCAHVCCVYVYSVCTRAYCVCTLWLCMCALCVVHIHPQPSHFIALLPVSQCACVFVHVHVYGVCMVYASIDHSSYCLAFCITSWNFFPLGNSHAVFPN